MRKEFLTRSLGETRRLGRILAQKLMKEKHKKALVLGLVGDLGGGKTSFVQGFAKGLGIKEKILSPTFIIIRRLKNFYHIDCYRIKKPKEILDLGFREIISNPENIVAVEWADKIKRLLPKDSVLLKFEIVGKNKRCLTIWKEVLNGLEKTHR